MAHSSAKPPKRKVNRKGRNKHHPYVKLDHYLLKTKAWQSLMPPARALYVELSRRYNGRNNGDISFSVRQAADAIHVGKDTASTSFHALEQRGFIKRMICGSFDWKLRHATTWVLTEKPIGEDLPTKEFARWKPEKEKPSLNGGTPCPCSGTGITDRGRILLLPVLLIGSWVQSGSVSRSGEEDTYNIPWGRKN